MIRTTQSWRLVAAAAAAGLTLAACGTTDDSGDDDGGERRRRTARRRRSPSSGALTGPDAGLGINTVNGAELALDEYNEENPDCKVELVKQFDSQGDPEKATRRWPTRSSTTTTSSASSARRFSGESRGDRPDLRRGRPADVTAVGHQRRRSPSRAGPPSTGPRQRRRPGPAVGKVHHRDRQGREGLRRRRRLGVRQGPRRRGQGGLGDAGRRHRQGPAGQTDFRPTVTKVNGVRRRRRLLRRLLPRGRPVRQAAPRRPASRARSSSGDGVEGPGVRRGRRRRPPRARSDLPVRPGETVTDFDDAYTETFSDDAGHLRGRGLRRRQHLPGRHRRGHHRPRGDERVRQQLRRRGHQQARSRSTRTARSRRSPIWAYEVKDGEIDAASSSPVTLA